MIVRIRFNEGAPKRLPAREAPEGISQTTAGAQVERTASGLAAVLTPAAVLMAALALWKLGADLGMAHEFVVGEGVLSRWQVWFAGAVLAQGGAFALNRREKPAGPPQDAVSLPPAARFEADRHAGRRFERFGERG